MTPKIKNPILVAEISANHNGSIIRAKKLIDTAKKYYNSHNINYICIIEN